GHEILGRPLLADPLAILDQLPARELFQLPLGLLQTRRLDAPFARQALLGTQLFDRLGLHGTRSFRRRKSGLAPRHYRELASAYNERGIPFAAVLARRLVSRRACT